MKKLIFLLSFSILFQSCFSYKSIGYNNIEIDKKQKIKVLMLNITSIKGQLVSKNEKTMILETKDGQGAIPVEQIYAVKVRKFSFLKSAGLTVGTFVGALLIGISILASYF